MKSYNTPALKALAFEVEEKVGAPLGSNDPSLVTTNDAEFTVW